MAIQRCDIVINSVFYSWQKKHKEPQNWEDSAKKSLWLKC